jgi:hypothetical protein
MAAGRPHDAANFQRMKGPTQTYFDRNWLLPDVEVMK